MFDKYYITLPLDLQRVNSGNWFPKGTVGPSPNRKIFMNQENDYELLTLLKARRPLNITILVRNRLSGAAMDHQYQGPASDYVE